MKQKTKGQIMKGADQSSGCAGLTVFYVVCILQIAFPQGEVQNVTIMLK